MDKKLTMSALLLVGNLGVAHAQVSQDKEWIKQQCGCFEVTFDYQEVFPQQDGYVARAPYHAQAAAEWVFVVEEGPKHVVLQHLLVVADTMVVKHWRQDWHYEKGWLTAFDAPMDWKKQTIPSAVNKKAWTQTVYQVDDSPRYAGTGRWVSTATGAFWEAHADAPLPRREHTVRQDYNVMVRRNRHEINAQGWVHEQDNLKVLRKAVDTILVGEKGYNRYIRQDLAPCQVAVEWWAQHAAFWNAVRHTWDAYLTQQPWIVETQGKVFWKEISALEEKYSTASTPPSSQLKSDIEQIMQQCFPQAPQSVGLLQNQP